MNEEHEALRRSVIPLHRLLALCGLAALAPAGCFVEIGVYKGGSAWFLDRIAASQRRELFLYDTFSGIPVAGVLDSHKIGDFSDTSTEDVAAFIPRARVIPGIFPDSLVPMPPVGFVHADADQYESTAAICRALPPLMVAGGIIVFDDYAIMGCRKAVDEHFQAKELPDGRAVVRLNGLES